MAARKQPYHNEEIRQRIKTSQLINRLFSHANGDVDMTATQVSAALGLLKKSLPDLQAVQHSGGTDNSVTVTIEKRTYASDNAPGKRLD